MMIKFWIAFSFLTSINLYCQNLVPNYSFEEYSNCPYEPSQLSFAFPWTTPSSGTSDFFHECFGPCEPFFEDPICVPTNIFGFQYARTGLGYAGIFVYENSNYREYLQCPLVSTLQAGEIYEVKFYVSLPDIVYPCASEIGIAFQHSSTFQSTYQPLTSLSSIFPSSSLINDTINWMLISGDYVANGSEDYLIIGNFKDNSSTNHASECGFYYAYYFIDDVSVMLKETSSSSELTNLKWSIYPNPSNDLLLLDGFSNLESVAYKISNQFGEVVASGSIFQNSIDIRMLQEGLYFLSLGGSTLKFIKNKGF
jgi:OOP family OmpA-OmpF porin